MQNYDKPKSRNMSIAAGKVGGNQTQGAGTLPNKAPVEFPKGPAASMGKPGSKAKAPAGFAGGVIPGKI